MAVRTDAGVTADSHAWPVFSVDTCDALGIEDRRVAPNALQIMYAWDESLDATLHPSIACWQTSFSLGRS
ncbi:hypothetical protein [Haloarcula sp. CBA1127]|uniref:hypothetical protein n=1 Tax=Haloarcula sp. CBA1127 TaxID=1765055 RepID=UPI00073E725B|nr:hypothetical protein [Haloarcula sp. CBA1127]